MYDNFSKRFFFLAIFAKLQYFNRQCIFSRIKKGVLGVGMLHILCPYQLRIMLFAHK